MKHKPAQHRLTDRDGDVLNMYHLDDGLYCTTQRGNGTSTATAGPFTPEQLRAALDEVAPAGSYTRTDEEDWQARAEKAERERDEWKDSAVKAMADLERAEHPHPLTPDAIESVLHDILPLSMEHLEADDIAGIAFDLHAALTEPTRPEGAAELHQVLDAIYQDEPGITHRGNLADMLATYGVRVAPVGLTPTNPEEQQ